MSNRHTRCGIYSITAPSGSMYIGSSNRIERRWHEHRSNLRHGRHHSVRLQAAWDKYEGALAFAVLADCAEADLNALEQQFINQLQPALNTSEFVENVLLNASTRKKFAVLHTSQAWRAARAAIAAEAKNRAVAVDCSDGKRYAKMADAARAYGVSTSAIAHLVKTQRPGQKTGVRFKLATEEWREVLSSAEQRLATMVANGTLNRSEEARARMSESAKRRQAIRRRDDSGRYAAGAY